MKSLFNLTKIAAGALIAIGLSVPGLADTKTTDNPAAQQKAVELINQLNNVARDVRYNSEQLDSFNRRIQISEWSHTYHLNQIKALVNNGLNPALAQLQDLQSQLPAWKQQSIDKMLKSATALAADANSAILERNDSGTSPLAMNADYKAYIKQVSEHAQNLIKTSDAAAAYATAHMKAQDVGIAVPPQS